MKTVIVVCAFFTLGLSAQDGRQIQRQIQLAAIVNANLNSSPDREIAEEEPVPAAESSPLTIGHAWRVARVYKKPRLIMGSGLHLVYEKRVVILEFSRSRLLGAQFSVRIRDR